LGEYRLVETMAPEGYLLPDEPVKLYVSSAGVQAMQGNNQSNVTQSAEDGPWTVEVWNTAGVELPNTGGPGSGVFTCLGVVLIALAGAILCRRYVRI
jgi:LPXTG-motif cell wall-anchored protein